MHKEGVQQLLNVGVLMGGKSIEREVSFNSGRTICDHLDTTLYKIIPIFQTHTGTLYLLPWHFLHRGKINDFLDRLPREAQQINWDDLPELVDFIYIAMHGRYAEDGTVQGFLEILSIPYLGSKTFASALCMDKIPQKDFLRAHQIDVPRDVVLHPHEQHTITLQQLQGKLAHAQIELPCIVKPHKEGSSLGISVVSSLDELPSAIEHAATVHQDMRQAVLIEEKLRGMEFCGIVITDATTGKPIPLPPTEVVPEGSDAFFDYDQKYMPGRAQKFTPARCGEETNRRIQKVCVQTMHALGIQTIARVDGFVTHDERIVVIDPNTLTGMAPSTFLFRAAAEIGMSHTDLVNHLIAAELRTLPTQKTVGPAVKYTNENGKRIRVAVLLGGNSHEREISLESGRNICYKLAPHKYQAIPIFVTNDMKLYEINQRLLVQHATHAIAEHLNQAKQIRWSDLPKVADFVFIGLHGGHGENGDVQGTLEMLGLPYNGSSILASALCMDKFKTNQFLRTKGFVVPAHHLITQSKWQQDRDATLKKLQEKFALPIIIKPHDDGCSMFVHKVAAPEELAPTLDEFFTTDKTIAMVEEFITGMELTIAVLGNEKPQALPPSYAVASETVLSIEEKFLPGAGENQTPAPLPPETIKFVQQTVERVYQAVDCQGYARIDCFYQDTQQSPTGEPQVVIIEINTLPGMTPATCIFHQAAEVGMRPMEFIDKIVASME